MCGGFKGLDSRNWHRNNLGGLHRRIGHPAGRKSGGVIRRNLHPGTNHTHRLSRTGPGAPAELDEDGGNGHRCSNRHHSTLHSAHHPHRLPIGGPHDAARQGSISIPRAVQVTRCLPLAPSPGLAAIPRRTRVGSLGPWILGCDRKREGLPPCHLGSQRSPGDSMDDQNASTTWVTLLDPARQQSRPKKITAPPPRAR